MEDMAGRVEAWDPARENPVTFRTDEKQESAQGGSDYFTASADRVHFFTEIGVVYQPRWKQVWLRF